MNDKKEYDNTLTKEDKKVLGDKAGNLRNDGGDDQILKNRKDKIDFEGKELDIPGRKLAENKTSKSLKDEENQIYGIGSEQNENLEQDKGSSK